jgi:hypothetical protein
LPKDYNCDCAASQGLLIGKIFIRRYQNFEARPFGVVQKLAVFLFIPAASAGFSDGVMVNKVAGKGARRAIVK